VAVCLLAGALVSLAGCRSMTTEAAVEEALAEIERQEAEKLKEEQEEKAAQLAAQAEEIEKKNAELQAKMDREQLKVDAINALNSGEPQEAYDKLQEIFDPPPRPKKDPETGEPVVDEQGNEVLVEAPDPTLEKIEEARLRYLEGSVLYQLERNEEAIQAFERAVQLDPEFRPARRDFGKILFILGNTEDNPQHYKRALEVWQPELEKGYRDADLLFLVGQARYEVGKAEQDMSEWEAARIAFQQVLVERPRDMDVKRWLAILEFETGRYDEAIRLFEVIRNQKPLDPEYLELLANAYIKVDNYRKAVDYLELSARVKPPTADICRTLGDLYSALGLFSRSAEWFVRAYGSNCRQAPVDDRINVGLLFADAGRTDEAIEWLSCVEKQESGYARAQSNLAWLHEEAGDYEKALAAYERASEVSPEGKTFLAIGDIYLWQLEKLDEATEAYARASALADREVQAEGHAGLAEVAYKRDNLQEAQLQYQKALAIRPDEARFSTALKQISEEAKYRQAAEGPGGLSGPEGGGS
jgi:superkiller protein 3